MAQMLRLMEQVPDDPMAPEWIGVHSKGMQQWITLQAAVHFNVCANMKFVFPRQMVEHILNGQPTLAENGEGLDSEDLFWQILNLILDPAAAGHGLKPVSDYIGEETSGKKAFQLARTLSALFDDYMIYRPDMLAEWQNTKRDIRTGEAAAHWQAQIWQQISPDPLKCLPGRIQHFLERFKPDRIIEGHLPERMILFGLSALPDIFLQVFEKVSGIMDIHVFLMIPSNQYFFDLYSTKQLGQMALKSKQSASEIEQLHFETANHLLASMGRPVQWFCGRFENFEYAEPVGDLFLDPAEEPPSVLSCLQSDIFHLVSRHARSTEYGPFPVETGDGSIQIHACHSPLRETQVLKDLLLDEFEQNDSLMPHDVVVMMPDIESYAPFIESVFSLEHPLPFAISDRRKRSESKVIKAFCAVLEMAKGRLEKKHVLDLLQFEPIVRRFDIDPEHILKIEQMVSDAGILWGRDGHHRQTLGLPPVEENTWLHGLNRLFLGAAMPENYQDLVAGRLPCQSLEGLELEILGKLANFSHTLFETLDDLKPERLIPNWCRVVKKIIQGFISAEDRFSEDRLFLTQTIDAIEQEAVAAGGCAVSKPFSFEIMTGLIEHKLNLSVAQGGFMAGRITFCNIMPMRSIPYKIVVLMGMDESAFPRETGSHGFDLIKKSPKPGDKNQRDEDRYLFLESLLSARKKLIITYTGMDSRDNTQIPCAGVVSELCEMLDQGFIFPESHPYYVFHRLHPFDRQYFLSSDKCGRSAYPPFSYSQVNCQIACSLLSRPEAGTVFITPYSQAEPSAETKEVNLEEIILFFRHPIKMWATQKLNLEMPLQPEGMPDREPFSISGLDQYLMGSRLMEMAGSKKKEDFFDYFSAAGQLPYGEKGRLEYERIADAVQPLIEQAQPVLSEKGLNQVAGSLEIGSVIVSGTVPDIRQQGRLIFTFGRLTAQRLISAWISHLFMNLAAPAGYPKQSILIGRGPSALKPVKRIHLQPVEKNARKNLADLVRVYQAGLKEPVHLFCETAWQFVQALAKADNDLSRETVQKIINQAGVRQAWSGSRFHPGEKDDRYNALVMAQQDPFRHPGVLEASGFIDLAVTVYQPLLTHMETVL